MAKSNKPARAQMLSLSPSGSRLFFMAILMAALTACVRPTPPRPKPLAVRASMNYYYLISQDLLDMADVSYDYMKNNYTYRIQPYHTLDSLIIDDERFVINWDITVVHRFAIKPKYDLTDTAFLRHYGLLRDTYNIYCAASFLYIPILEDTTVAMSPDTLAYYQNLSHIGLAPRRYTLAELDSFLHTIEADRQLQIDSLERCYEITTDSFGTYSLFKRRLYWQ